MKQDEKNKAYFQETFQEVHAPEGLGRKVKNMTKTEAKKKGMPAVKKLAVAAAIAFGIGGKEVAAKLLEQWYEKLKK